MSLLTEQLEQMTRALREQQQELNYWKEKAMSNDQNGKGNSGLEEEILRLHKTLEEKDIDNQKIKSQFQALEQAYVQQNSQNQQYQTEYNLAVNRQRVTENENQQLKQQMTILQQQIFQLQQQLMNGNNKDLEQLNKQLKSKLDAKSDELIIITNQNDVLRQAQADLQHKLDAVKDQHSSCNDIIQAKTDEVTKLKQLLDQSTIQRVDTDLNEDLKAEITNCQQIIQILRSELEKARNNGRNSFSSVFDTTQINNPQNLSKDAAEAKHKENVDLAYQCQIMKDQIEKQINYIVQLETENQALKERVKSDQVDIQRVQALMAQVEELTNQLGKVNNRMITEPVDRLQTQKSIQMLPPQKQLPLFSPQERFQRFNPAQQSQQLNITFQPQISNQFQSPVQQSMPQQYQPQQRIHYVSPQRQQGPLINNVQRRLN